MPRQKRASLNFMTPRERQLKLKKNSATSSAAQSTSNSRSSSLTSTSDRDKISVTPKSSRAKQSEKRNQWESKASSRENSEIPTVVKSNTKQINHKNKTQGKDDNRSTRGRGKLPSIHNEVQKDTDTKTEKKTNRKKGNTINNIAPKKKQTINHHQSITGHTITRTKNDTSAKSFNSSASSISKLSDTPSHVISRLDSQTSQSACSPAQLKTSQKRKLPSDKFQHATPNSQAKKLKKSKKPSPSCNETFTSVTSSASGRSRVRQPSGIPVNLDRIRDLKVTKKSFQRWKPMSKVTIAFVEDIVKSVILNVSAEANLVNDEDAGKCLSTIKSKVMERLPNLKAPHTKGDYRKMASENKLAEDVYREKSRELNVLDKKIKEEQSLLDSQTTMVVEHTKKLEKYEHELEVIEEEKTHPLIKQTKNVLNLPQLPSDFFSEDQDTVEDSIEEKNLRKTLQDLRENTKDVGLQNWMDRLAVFSSSLP